MINDVKEIFKLYEEVGGYVSLIRFMRFSKVKCETKTYKTIEKSLKSFEKKIENNEMYVRKDFINFKNFVLNK
jgi:hypothetical protein